MLNSKNRLPGETPLAFLFKLAWRNLWRHPKRTLMTTLAMTLTSGLFIFMLAFQLGSYNSMKLNALSLLDGYGQFQHPDYLDQPSLRNSFTIPSELDSQLRALPGLVAFGYRTQAFGLLSADDRNQGALVLGVEPQHEPKISRLAQLITQGRFLTSQDQASMVMGQTLARQLNLSVGDEVQLLGQDKQGSLAADIFILIGVFNSGSPELDRQLTLIPFHYSQALFGLENQAHQLSLVTASFQQIERLEPQLNQLAHQHQLAFQNWRTLQPGVAQGIDLDYYAGFIWYIAILLIVVLILFNTLLMSALEREREFGLMLSLGLSRKQLAWLTQIETHLTLSLGLILGIALGILVTLYFYQTGITIPGTEDMFAEFGLDATTYPILTIMAIGFAPGFLWLSTWLMSAMIVWRIFGLNPLSGRQTK